MVALVNEAGVRVDVSPETAARLGREWKPVEAEPKPAPKRSRSRK